jgi:hypothetical protein
MTVFQTKGRFRESFIRLIKCTIVLVCARQGKMVHSGSLLSPALCGIMWSRVMCPFSTQATQPPLPETL